MGKFGPFSASKIINLRVFKRASCIFRQSSLSFLVNIVLCSFFARDVSDPVDLSRVVFGVFLLFSKVFFFGPEIFFRIKADAIKEALF